MRLNYPLKGGSTAAAGTLGSRRLALAGSGGGRCAATIRPGFRIPTNMTPRQARLAVPFGHTSPPTDRVANGGPLMRVAAGACRMKAGVHAVGSLTAVGTDSTKRIAAG